MPFSSCRLHHIEVPLELKKRFLIQGRYKSTYINYQKHRLKISLSNLQTLKPYTLCELKHTYPHLRFDLPIVVEFCSGTGEFLIQLAQHFPNYFFIGVELAMPCVERALLKIGETISKSNQQNYLNNIVFYTGEGNDFIEHDFNTISIDRIMVNFPDPWSKKRHHKRRIISKQFVKNCKARLKQNGYFYTATDVKELFTHHLETINPLLNLQSTYTSKTTYDNTPKEHQVPLPTKFYSYNSRYQLKNLSHSNKVYYTHHQKTD